MPIPDSARYLYRRLFGARRHLHRQPGPLPDFVIIGAQKAGTTALFDMFSEHPEISPSTVKEVHYFDSNYERGEQWYRRHFDRHIAGEASPYYLFYPPAHDRMKALIPKAKVIAILRDPVERALSHYDHEVEKGYVKAPIMEALRAEEQRTDAFAHNHLSFVGRGRYLPQLERWQDFDLLVLSNRELRETADETFARACRHVGATPIPAPKLESNVGVRRQPPDEARRFLEERLAGEKEAVEARYGIRL